MRHQITNHISKNDNAFKNFLMLQDDHEDISGLNSYICKMGQDSAWGGCPEVYMAAWIYGVNITIFAQKYANTGGFLVFKWDGPKDDSCNAIRTMWTLSYQCNNHYNSICSPGNPSHPINHIMNVKQFQANLQSALDNYYNDVAQLVSSSTANNLPIPPHEIDSIQMSTQSIMSYIAVQLSDAGGEVVSVDCMGNLSTQAKERALEYCCVASTQATDSAPSPDIISLAWSAILQYEAELYTVIKRHHKGILQLLLSSSARGSMPDISSQYVDNRSTHLSIISDLEKLILHLGGKEISSHNLEELTHNAEEEAIRYMLLQCPRNVDHLVLPLPPPTLTVLINVVIPFIKLLSLGMTRTSMSDMETCFWARTSVPDMETCFCVRRKGWRQML
jgi:hypothetical protein